MTIHDTSQRRFLFPWAALGIAVFAWGVGTDCLGDDWWWPYVARVEEDWELVVDQPDTGNNGPQVTCTISPLRMSTAYAALDLNYRTQPDYSAGGLQLHSWDPYNPIVTREFPPTQMLATEGETITWTQTMTLDQGTLTFRVVNGVSQTWGNFGSDDQAITLTTQLTSLNGYDPRLSVENSGVSFASNLVRSLTLRSIRWYDAAGVLLWEYSDPLAVHPKP